MKTKTLISYLCLIVLLEFSSIAAHADFFNVYSLNRQAIQSLKQEKPQVAKDYLIQALAQDPLRAELHFNLGLVYEALGQNDLAVKSYEDADRYADSSELQFLSRFNIGALLQKGKKIDEALKSYHAALDVKPESIETKINIELLIQEQDQNQKKQDQQKQDQQKQDQQKQGQSDQNKDQNKDQKKDENKDQDQNSNQKKDEPKEYAPNKPQPRPFKSEELSQSDVNKVLGELRNQEQRIRSEYNKKEVKERPRGKDW